MKLQKHLAYKYKKKEHYKHVVVIPKDMIKELGWEAGIELRQSINNDTLVLTPQSKYHSEEGQGIIETLDLRKRKRDKGVGR